MSDYPSRNFKFCLVPLLRLAPYDVDACISLVPSTISVDNPYFAATQKPILNANLLIYKSQTKNCRIVPLEPADKVEISQAASF